MAYEDAVEAYKRSLTELNAAIEEYNNLRKKHPDFSHRERLSKVPLETWASHMDTRYAAGKLKRVREGPLTNIKETVDGNPGFGLKDKVSEPSSRGFLERIFGESVPEGLDEDIRDALDDVDRAVDTADKAAQRLRKHAIKRYEDNSNVEE